MGIWWGRGSSWSPILILLRKHSVVSLFLCHSSVSRKCLSPVVWEALNYSKYFTVYNKVAMCKYSSGYLEHEDKYTVLEPHGSFHFYCSKWRLQVSVTLLFNNLDRVMFLICVLLICYHAKICFLKSTLCLNLNHSSNNLENYRLTDLKKTNKKSLIVDFFFLCISVPGGRSSVT